MRITRWAIAALLAAAALTACAAAPSRPAPFHPAAAPSALRTRTAATPLPAAASPVPARIPSRPTPNHCAGNRVAQQVVVSIRSQHLWMCARHHTVYSSAVTTGMVGEWTGTPTGNYWIQGRVRNTVLTLNTGAAYRVRYWIPFDAPLFGFHDASWQRFPFGSALYRTRGSHGCVHMPLRAIAFLYRWAARPTAVHIA